MGRRPCCVKEGVNRGAWSAREDQILVDYIKTHGEGKWRDLPLRAGLNRCGKSCRLRWLNYLRPDIKRGNISEDEEELIIRLHRLLGNRWSLIAGRLPGRTDNEIKNYWNTNLSKRVHGASPPPTPASRRHLAPKQLPDQHQTNGAAGSSSSRDRSAAAVIRTKAFRCTAKLFHLPVITAEARRGTTSPAAAPDEEDPFGNMLLDLDIDELMCSTEELELLRTNVIDGRGGEDGGTTRGGEEYCHPSTTPEPDGRRTVVEEAVIEEWRECLQPVDFTQPGLDASCLLQPWPESE